jgi:hypothetical protein
MSTSNTLSTISRFKTFYAANPWKGRALLIACTLCLLLIIVRLMLTPTIIYNVNSWLKNQGIDSSIEDVKIGLFNGTVSLINAKGSRNNETVFDIGLVDIHWRWAPLSNKTIEVTDVIFDRINFNIEKYDNAIVVSGIKISVESETAADSSKGQDLDTDTDKTHWSAALGALTLKNLDVCYLQHEISIEQASNDSRLFDYCVNLEEMSWNGTINYGAKNTLIINEDVPLSSTGNFTLNGLTVRDNKLDKILLASKANTLTDVKISGLSNIHIAEFDMNELSALERDDQKHIDTVRFKKLSIKNINFTHLNSLSMENIQLNEPGLYLVKNNKETWEHQPWIPASNTPAQVAPEKQEDKTKGSVFDLSIKNISINAPDLCYLEKNTTQYYCFTAQTLEWNGNIQYNTSLQTKGSAKFLQAEIRNLSLGRNLLSINSINLDQLNVSDLSNINLKRFSIAELSALQRGEDLSDNTASFSELLINDIRYTKNKIIIDTINLSDISSNVSINKDGQWEHSKWITDNNSDTTEAASSDTKNRTEEANTLLLALNKLIISTDKKNLFTDNSTKPETIAGLDKLSLDLSKLDSDKPDTDSLIKLFAKTTRHSTIDLKGTLRPFADKVSMNADGKLKGFDLRAASPTAQKAIGHIIKSGQLDADITLRATDGILDSNIALSLYHFNLKALSKKDAKALDDLFGLPINQSLVLLRDKDDSIHLDIPITGDVNKPDFNPMDAIIKATTKATTVTLITFYTPYGLIYAGGNVLLDLATALNFDPVVFETGSSQLSDSNKDELTSLTKLLTEKPQIHLTLCGVTNTKDYGSLFSESKQSSKELDTVKAPSENQAISLDKLARERQVKVKNYLVNEKGIEHDRLILCAPDFNSDKDAISGVEVTI